MIERGQNEFGFDAGKRFAGDCAEIKTRVTVIERTHSERPGELAAALLYARDQGGGPGRR